MLETIRHDALERLEAVEELTAARGAHLLYWSAWAAGHNLHFECDFSVLDDVHANLGNLTAAVSWACATEPRHLVPLMLAVGMSVPLEDDSTEGMGVFSSALATLEDVDEVGWAHVAMAAVVARALTWVFPPDDPLRRRIEAIATEHDLVLVHTFLAFVRSSLTTVDPAGLEAAGEQFAAAGSEKWSTVSMASAARFYAATGEVEAARRLLDRVESDPGAPWLARQVVAGTQAQLGIVSGDLIDVVRRARDDLDRLPPLDRSKFSAMSVVAYENVGRAAFFAGDREVLEWVTTRLARVATSGITRRVAVFSQTYLRLFGGTEKVGDARTRIVQTLRHRAITGSSTGGGLLQRETLYLAVAASDNEWIAAERSSLERFASDGDRRIPCSLHLADAVLAMADEGARPEEHWHDLLAEASEQGYRILQIDALEGLALCAARADRSDEAARLAGAAARAAGRVRLPLPIPAPRRAAGRLGRGAVPHARRGNRVRPPRPRRATSADHRLARAHADRDRSRRRRGRGPHQPTGRRATLHERANRQDPSPARVREARDRQPRPAHRPGGAAQPVTPCAIPRQRSSSHGRPITESLHPVASFPSSPPISSQWSMFRRLDRTTLVT